MIAMALACEPKLLIADEPTTALDVTIQRQILELLAGLKERHRMSMLFISHDLGVVGEIADHVVVMRHGIVREQGAVADIFATPQDSYTKALLACRPSLDQRAPRLLVVDDHIAGRSGAGVDEEEGSRTRASSSTRPTSPRASGSGAASSAARNSRRCAARPSSCAPATRSASSANRARARRRSA